MCRNGDHRGGVKPCQGPAGGMMARVRLIALLAATAALLLAACGSTAASAPASLPSASVPATGSPSEPPSVAASTPAASAATPRPSVALVLPHEAPELEAHLPDEVDGRKLTKLSNGPVASLGNAGAQALRDATKRIGDG